MSIEKRNEAATTVVTLFGNLEGSRSAQLNDYIDRVFEEEPKRVVVDLSQVDYMASTGLALLVSAFKRAANRNIPLVFAGPPRSVSDTLAITKLDSLLPIYASVGEAVSDSALAR